MASISDVLSLILAPPSDGAGSETSPCMDTFFFFFGVEAKIVNELAKLHVHDTKMLKWDFERNKKTLKDNLDQLATEWGIEEIQGKLAIDPKQVWLRTQSMTELKATPQKPTPKLSYEEKKSARMSGYSSEIDRTRQFLDKIKAEKKEWKQEYKAKRQEVQ